MHAMPFAGSSILVVGGAGFIGSNLLNLLLPMRPRRVIVVDNLLSADTFNLPELPEVDFRLGSIADDRILDDLPADLDFVYHLACYHGNQSSIHDPLADHDNNTLTTLKLFDRLKTFPSLKKVVYAAAGCAVAEKTYADAKLPRRKHLSHCFMTARTRFRNWSARCTAITIGCST